MATVNTLFHIPMSEKGYFYKQGKFSNYKGIGWFITGLFLVGDMAGGGLVALPVAFTNLGFELGLFFLLFTALVSAYTGHILGLSWVILQKRWPAQYTVDHIRKPFPEIALRAMGPVGKNLASFVIMINQFGVAVVYTILPAKGISSFIKLILDVDINFCWIILLIGAAILPIIFLKSPKDFWFAIIMAMVTTAAGVLLITLGAALDYGVCSYSYSQKTVNFEITRYCSALGTFIFAYTGHAIFPTVQHDMIKPHHFTRSVVLAFAIMTAIYLPVAIMGYITYGDSIRETVVNSLQTHWIQQTVNILITGHCLLALTLKFNPINQELEEVLKTPQHFGPQRVFIRTGMLLAVIFVAESVPNFSPLIDLIGGSTLTLTSLVFPCIFYLYLYTGEKLEEERKTAKRKIGDAPLPVMDPSLITIRDVFTKTDKTTLCLCLTVLAFAVFGGSAATISALHSLAGTQFVPPCYVSAFLKDSDHLPPGMSVGTNCCGMYRNISIYANPDKYCNN